MSVVGIAARNNAEWCDIVCRTHGLPTAFHEHAWTCAQRAPELYPDAVTLSAAANAEDVLPRIDTAEPGGAVKDSFARLDLGPAGFRILFDASWIHRPAGPPVPETTTRWSVLDTAPAPFRPELLAEDAVRVIGGASGGAILNRSAGAVGISNLFSLDGDTDAGTDAAWADAVSLAERLFPGVPLVGYERGESLEAALHNGFRQVGPLRVWYR